MILKSNRALEIAIGTIRNFLQDGCTLLAAAIAFYALLSLAPSLYLIGAGLSVVFEGIDTSRQIVDLIANFLPPAAVPTVESVQHTLQVRGDLAVPGLLWIATHAVSAFEYALNIAFARNSGQWRIWHSRVKGFAVLVASGLFLAAFFLSYTVLPFLSQFSITMGFQPIPDPLTFLGSALVSPALTFLVFYLFYRFLPSGRH